MAELGLREQFEHRCRQQVRRRMPVDLERLGILVGEDAQVGVFFERTSQVDQVAIGLGGKRSVGETRADGLGDIKGSSSLRDFLGAAVGELNVNAVRHGLGLVFR